MGRVHQLRTDFKKDFDLKVFYDILIEFRIPMKLVRVNHLHIKELNIDHQ